MKPARYYVSQSEAGWNVRFKDQDYAYTSQAAAMEATLYAANKAGLKGRDAQVLVQGVDGEWRTAWTYGQDPYPSKR